MSAMSQLEGQKDISFDDVDIRAAAAIQEELLRKVDANQKSSTGVNTVNPGWLKRILGRGGKESTLSNGASIVKEKISSEEFCEGLTEWEPWRLNEQSVKKGKNLHVRLAKAYADAEFKTWLSDRSRQLEVDEDELLAGVIEIMRRFEWEALKFLAANGDSVKTGLPLTIININPSEARTEALNAWGRSTYRSKHQDKRTRDENLYKLFNPELTDSDKSVYLGRRVTGSASSWYKPIGIYSHLVRGSIDRFLEGRVNRADGLYADYGLWDLANVVIEETLHYAGYKDDEIRTQAYEKSKTLADNADPELHRMMSQEVPAHEHINDLADRLASHLISSYGDSLLKPLEEKIGPVATLKSTWRNRPGAI